VKHFSHLNTAVQLISQYKGEMPFSIFLKSFFAQHKKYGSKDRKSISHLCYCYFRLGKALPGIATDEKILTGLFLCDERPTDLLQQLKPGWNNQLTINEKLDVLRDAGISFSLTDIFPWKELLSNGIDHEQFCRSLLIQPDLFLRLRPGHEHSVKQKLSNAGINFTEVSPTCLSLSNSTKVDSVIDIDKEAVVQDLNSQAAGNFFKTTNNKLQTINTWDCCAASGGKSILAYDLIPNIHLTASDIRESIINNLKQRFARAGITNYKTFVADLSKPQPPNNKPQAKYDLIVLDAPCSGSGTWSRTPEQLVFFETGRIDHYAKLQQTIAANVIPHLAPNGRLVYITCSVFKKENEEILELLKEKLQLEKMEVLKGYDKKADTLFAAGLTTN
jgi:16S rRNA (cytosine967-C5)-methyltransferase